MYEEAVDSFVWTWLQYENQRLGGRLALLYKFPAFGCSPTGHIGNSHPWSPGCAGCESCGALRR
ncbi:hypothetical protein NITMOv2_0426 [Nitrospira moscoviensis]|uniref:Uncharacterized protein n=1 Tax=Nitrospira moscoviensis TaxID=42253 RepID=A0A0K2G8D8_NITMO|nr:hypothetical protein NITMOv2_0426 [Nitrospira moscoviensis]